MSDIGGSPSRPGDADDREGRLRELIRRAGPRPALPPDLEQRLFDAAHADWQATLRHRRRVRATYAAAAVVAVFVVTSLIALWDQARDASHALVVTTSSGRVTVQRDGDDRLVEVGSRVLSGDVVRTASASGAVLRRDDGLEVRVGERAELAWNGPTARVSAGRLYVESHAASPDDAPLVLEAGRVRIAHLGTEYLVDAATPATVVAVRDGAVAVSTAADRTVVRAGDAVRVRGDALEPVAAATAVDWSWADALGAPLAIEGRTVDDALAEAARRAGVGVRYVDSATRSRARRVTLHGPALQLAPGEAIRAVLTAGGFAGRIEAGAVVVRAT